MAALQLGFIASGEILVYVAGALVAGMVADTLGVASAIATVGLVTIASGMVVAIRFNDAVILDYRSARPQAVNP